MTTRATNLVGRSLLGGKLQVEELIGRGGIGMVYRARHRELRTAVAVKVVSPPSGAEGDFARRFREEALAASQLHHRNLTRVYDFGEEPDGLVYIVMDLLDGKDLRDVLEAEGALAPDRAVYLMQQVCAGLGHAHARGVIHRDVKPENLVVSREIDDEGHEVEVVRVCDFGIACAASTGPSSRVSGTPAYMSPEQCQGTAIDERSDVYGAGVVLYELITGRRPFGGDAEDVMRQHCDVDPVPPSRYVPALDPRLEQVVLAALAKEPRSRPQSMRAMRVDLLRVAEPDAPAQPPSPRPSVPDWLEDRRTSYVSFLHRSEPPPAASSRSSPPAASPPWSCATAVAELVDTHDATAFASLLERLGDVLPALAARGDAEALWRLLCTTDGIASELPHGGGARARLAAAFVERLCHREVLGPVATIALGESSSRAAAARKILVRAGASGAHAAYSARVRDRAAHARQRFVEILVAIGPPAAPLIRAALERLGARLAIDGAAEVAHDLHMADKHLAQRS